MKNTAILLIDCPDRPGIVAAVAGFLYQHGANILHADQHQDNELRLFFMRVEFSLEGFDLPPGEFRAQFEPLARQFAMNWRIEYSSRLISAAIFVSREQHCLIDLLHRHQSGELRCRIPLIISNHPDAIEVRVGAFLEEVDERRKKLLTDAGTSTNMRLVSRGVRIATPGRIPSVNFNRFPAATVTGSDGRFRFSGVPPGKVSVLVGTGRDRVRREVYVASAPVETNLVLPVLTEASR